MKRMVIHYKGIIMKNIEILGFCYANCKKAEEAVRKALTDIG